MTPLIRWAHDYQIPPQALQALMLMLGADAPPDPVPTAPAPPRSEAAVQQQTRLLAARLGVRLFRNNSGACTDKEGRLIRYGLANDSKQMNEKIKSPDLVGITTVVDPMSGWCYGVFTGYECKPEGWTFSPGDQRAKAQLTFGQLVIGMGGIWRFITDPNQITEQARQII